MTQRSLSSPARSLDGALKPTLKPSLKALTLWSALSILGGVSACDSASEPPPPPQSTPCGSGELKVSFGYGRPFEALSPRGLLIESGLQGGFHVDVSLRFSGALNPDLVDVELALALPEAENPDQISGRHVTSEWYLLYPPNGGASEEPEGCYFYEARVFLFQGDHPAAFSEPLEALEGVEATLSLTLRHEQGRFEAELKQPLSFNASF